MNNKFKSVKNNLLEKDHSLTSTGAIKNCAIPPLSSYPAIYPTYTTFCLKSFNNAVDFHPKEKLPCKNTWSRDIKSTHIRNRRLLDLPYEKPKCCYDIYNMIMDRQKLKKLQKYGLTRSVRTKTCRPEVEELKPCEPEKVTEEAEITYFPECYELSDSTSDEEDEKYEVCSSGSVSECSGCIPFRGTIRTKIHKVVKKDLRSLLHSTEEFCQEKVTEELKRHKLGRNVKLKLEKVF